VWIQWVVFAEPDDGGMSFVDHAPGPTYGHVARTASRTRNTDGGCRDPWRRGDLTGVTGKLRHATTVQPVGVCASAACRSAMAMTEASTASTQLLNDIAGAGLLSFGHWLLLASSSRRVPRSGMSPTAMELVAGRSATE
jgi:hypothetical protein